MNQNNYWSHNSSEIEEGSDIGKDVKIWHNSQIKKGAIVGEGCVIGHNCLINSGAKLGKGCKLQSNIDVWDGVVLEDFVFVGPSAVFTNDLNPRAKYPKSEYSEYGEWEKTLVKEGATIGANATIVCGITVGKWAMVGAGAVVTKDVPDYAIAVGCPAKIIGWICECGNKIDFDGNKASCKICQKLFEKEGQKVWEIKK